MDFKKKQKRFLRKISRLREQAREDARVKAEQGIDVDGNPLRGIVWGYENAPKTDVVVVLGGGPSLTKENLKKINDLVKDTPSKVFSANYYHPDFPPDYVVFSDRHLYSSQISKTPTQNIIVGWEVFFLIHEEEKKNHNFYVANDISNLSIVKESVYNAEQMILPPDGTMRYRSLGTAGFAAILLASICRPKRMILCGFDGPVGTRYKYNFRGEKIIYCTDEKNVLSKVKYFNTVLVPFLIARGIQVICPEEDAFWGVKKEAMGILTLEDAELLPPLEIKSEAGQNNIPNISPV